MLKKLRNGIHRSYRNDRGWSHRPLGRTNSSHNQKSRETIKLFSFFWTSGNQKRKAKGERIRGQHLGRLDQKPKWKIDSSIPSSISNVSILILWFSIKLYKVSLARYKMNTATNCTGWRYFHNGPRHPTNQTKHRIVKPEISKYLNHKNIAN